MTRPYRLAIWLMAIAVVGVCYACLPLILEELVKRNLSARGLNDVEIRVGYPDWRGIRIHSLQYHAIAGERHIFTQLRDVEIEYQLPDLLNGIVSRIRVPVAMVHVQPAPASTPSVETVTALPLAALLSGQWLSQLPLRELELDQLHVNWRTPADAVYTIQVNGKIRDAVAQINGELTLPKSQATSLAFSLDANKTGEAKLSVFSATNADESVLDLAINKVTFKQNQIQLNGVMNAKLASLMPILQSWLGIKDWMSELSGTLDSQWQAQIFSLPRKTGWQIAGKARAQDLTGQWRQQTIPPSTLDVDYEADSQRITAQTTLHAAEDAVVIEGKWTHQFATGKGHTDLKLMPVQFKEPGFMLSQLLEDWPYSFDVTGGRLSGTAQLNWQQTVDLHGIVQLDKLSGHYKQVAFAGLSGKIALANGKGLRTSDYALLRGDVVNIGFPVENIKVRFALTSHPRTDVPLLQIEQFSANLLGGQARSGPFELDFEREKNTFVVQLEQIGLDNIMKLEQQEGLSGSGMLDGQIPVEISSAGIVVTSGKLSARAPGGTIQYVPTERVLILAESNPSVKMVVEALSNFHYHVLEVNTDYQPEGDLFLQVRLRGKNPDWQAGQPVHLNLNLEENIPALLRSLQLSGEITERVRERYQDTD